MAPACEVPQHRVLPEEREPCPLMILLRGPGAIEAPGEKPAPIAVSADLRTQECLSSGPRSHLGFWRPSTKAALSCSFLDKLVHVQ